MRSALASSPVVALALGLALALACGGDDDGGGPDATPTGPARIRVTHYDFALDLASLATTATLTLAVDEGGDCVSLPLRATFAAARLDGEAARSAEVVDDVLTACGAGWSPGDEVLLAVDATLEPNRGSGEELGYTVQDDREGAPYHQLISWVGGCDLLTACDREPARFARYHFTIDHPAGTQVLCPGVLAPGETRSACDFDFAGGPTYSTFGLVAGTSWQAVPLGEAAGVRVVLHDTPTTGFAEDLSAEQVTGFLAWMVDRFGPYPYGDELRLVVGPTYWSGFEHPGNVTLNDRLNVSTFPPGPYTDGLHHTTFHEIAHQWAGDQTTLATTHDFVWKEAMAEYLTYVYEDEALGVAVSRRTASAWKSFAAGAAYYPVPGEAPPLADYYGDVYGAGPLVLFRQLEAMFGRDAVLAALATLLGEERTLSVGDVLGALERATGADLDGYADAWIYGEGEPTWPVFDVTTTPREGGVTVTVAQRDAEAGLYGCAFAVGLAGAGAGETAEAAFDLGVDGMAQASVDVDLAFEVTEVTFDPHASCLATMAAPAVAPVERAPRINPWIARTGDGPPPLR